MKASEMSVEELQSEIKRMNKETEQWREGRCVFHPNVVCDAHAVCSDYCFKGGKK